MTPNLNIQKHTDDKNAEAKAAMVVTWVNDAKHTVFKIAFFEDTAWWYQRSASIENLLKLF